MRELPLLQPHAYLTLGMADIASERKRTLLPDYTIRVSARAKHVRFKVTLADGLIVVVPKGFDRSRIPDLLEGRRAWLIRALNQIEEQRAAMPPPNQKPVTIELRAIGQSWEMDWIETGAAHISISDTEGFQLRILGSTQDRASWQSTLRRWLVERGREHLIPWTESLASEFGIAVRRVTIRCQKTRWGSYSTKGTVSLNAQLLLLPRRLARYVLIHEICHAVHPNHSPPFWRLMRQWEPEADRLRAELKTAGQFIPRWLNPVSVPSASDCQGVR